MATRCAWAVTRRPSAKPWDGAGEVAALRSAGYLHDIGKVAVDRRLFEKADALESEEFREMADHTVVGHQIVSSVEFPWPKIPETVRWHHERGDGSAIPMRCPPMICPCRCGSWRWPTLSMP